MTSAHDKENTIISEALEILDKRIRKGGDLLGRSSDVTKFITVNLATLEHEVFGIILMDQWGRYLHHEVLFRGTLLHTTVHPREVVKLALRYNASKAILYHNHPYGSLKPSPEDKQLTTVLKETLHVIDVAVIDHIIVAGVKSYSFREGGLL